ncbi:tetratricopeptide repeat protein [Granulicella mallensis]|jgi:tetratricopeptide (TPR) repeat protein|uniref:Tetratricopeptide (TPR) repeat protein n=1 Tax=Granulicella mallensis TaxID=940614 RepID=A0A7W7ZPW4_9BACT|nr:tetratricopeptide repeat protein [Granulicella mallensis]MBB5063955.1 tetratricopeptide (TPR) repeat protein [Granulicella mallensis]
MRLHTIALASLLAVTLPSAALFAQQTISAKDAPITSPATRALQHSSPVWAMIAPHLPNPETASAKDLETAGDVLRARRFPEDALDYYGYAMARGGDVSVLLNKMGVTRLELRQNALAHEMFLRTVRLHKKDSIAWNNLGVTEYATGNYRAAISDYKRASKLDSKSAVYHSNLGMAYFGGKDMESARKQFALAIQLDPEVLQHRDNSGTTAQLIGTENYSQLCFEIARLYAKEHNEAETRLWLAKASESGFDVRNGLRNDAVLQAYEKDPQLKLMLDNAAQLRAKGMEPSAPGLGEAPQSGSQNGR